MSITDPHDSSSSDHTGVRAWIKRNPLTALVLSAAVSLIVGLLIGSWATCGQQCGFNAALFGALGTWVGGLGTIGAFAFTAHELITSRRREEKLNKLREEEALIEARKILCYPEAVFEGSKHSDSGEVVGYETVITWVVRNRADFPMTHLRVLAPSGKEIDHRDQLKGRGSLWELSINASDLGVEYDPKTDESLPRVHDKVRVDFTMKNHRFQWHNQQVTPLDRLTP